MTTRDSELDLLLEKSRANAPAIQQQVLKASPAERKRMLQTVMAALEALPPDRKALAEEAIRRELARQKVDAHVSLGSASGGGTSGWQVFGNVLAVAAQVGVSVYAMEHDRRMASRADRASREAIERQEAMMAAQLEEERARRAAAAERQQATLPGLPEGINQQTLLIGGAALLLVVVLVARK